MSIFRYFQENSANHSSGNAFLLALASLYVYEDQPPRRFGQAFERRFESLFGELSAHEPFEIELYLQAGSGILDYPYDTQVALLANSRLIIVAFRGSEGPPAGIRDWLTNLGSGGLFRSTPDTWGPGRVHRGFYNALRSKYQDVRAWVRDRRHGSNPPKVFVTGHSLGGSLATLCAYRFQKVGGIDVAGVYTFGAPRVGDTIFRTLYDTCPTGNDQRLGQKTFRWVRNNDFAARLPIFGSVTGLGAPVPHDLYHDVGRLNFIRANNTIQMNRQSALGQIPSGISNPFADHDMPAYTRTMHGRLSTNSRNSPTSPGFLLRSDVTPLGV
jgi:pimeloyl-ACP methyl ester carboxylesterase